MLEHQLNASIVAAQVVERAAGHGTPAIDDGDVIRDLIDVGNLVRGKEDGHRLVGDMRDERLQHLLGDGGVKP